MTQKVDVKALANLARLEVADDELARLEKELPAILGFVEQIQSLPTAAESHGGEVRNVMREDGEPHESGLYTEDLLASAPAQRDDQVVVKQVISRKK